ncbi:MAG: class I SAM-dependent methyltransferase [Dehalococcoidia bacterium]|nr:class I SAM-dependent methyltransferase [Dehalococcoidia bacterium]
MLKQMSPAARHRAIARARASALSDAAVGYPEWYLQRWHFLPEGYLSRRSIAGYDHLIRRVYYSVAERAALKRLVANLPANSEAVLDLGCGPGRVLAAVAAARPRARLWGLDLSPFMLERARTRLREAAERLTLVHGDAARLRWPEAAFDLVLATHVLGHMPRAAAGAALAEAERALRPGARMLVVDHRWHGRLPTALREVRRERLAPGFAALCVLERPIADERPPDAAPADPSRPSAAALR